MFIAVVLCRLFRNSDRTTDENMSYFFTSDTRKQVGIYYKRIFYARNVCARNMSFPTLEDKK